MDLHSRCFGHHFVFGVSSSSLQTEGATAEGGRGTGIWEVFSAGKRAIRHGHHPHQATQFYYNYREDIALMASMGVKHFRFSVSWPRLIPKGVGDINPEGVKFYQDLADCCLEYGIEPWVTLYHWDLPHALEMEGGWTNRKIIDWFEAYVKVCAQVLKSRVKHFIILNEPLAFTGAGYFLGLHAPGKRGMKNFLPAMHHAVLCQAVGYRAVKSICEDARVGTTFSCSVVTAYTHNKKDLVAASRVDTLLNRLFIEPALGLGYPIEDLPFLRKLKNYMAAGDNELMKVDFDFIGIQNYTREVVKNNFWVPYIGASIVPARKRKVYCSEMNWEVYPDSVYRMIRQFNQYKNLPPLYVTENGISFQDKPVNGKVADKERIRYLHDCMQGVYRAKSEGMNIHGYFVWSFTDNFEWAEGYTQRFGLVYVDYENQQRIVKDSGNWYAEFLQND